MRRKAVIWLTAVAMALMAPASALAETVEITEEEVQNQKSDVSDDMAENRDSGDSGYIVQEEETVEMSFGTGEGQTDADGAAMQSENGNSQENSEPLDMLQSQDNPESPETSVYQMSEESGVSVVEISEAEDPKLARECPEEEAETVSVTGTLEESGTAENASLPLFSFYANEVYEGSYGAQLEGDAKKIYDALAKCGNQEFTVALSAQDNIFYEVQEVKNAVSGYAQSAYDALLFDCPECYWMKVPAYTYSIVKRTDANTDEATYTIQNNSITFKVGERFSGAYSMLSNLRAAVDAAAAEITDSFAADASETDKMQAVHDYVCEKVDYDHNYTQYSTSSAQNAYIHSPFGVFLDVNGYKVVCDGYAKAIKMLCDAIGLTCAVIPGNANGEAHAWNGVRLENGTWYLLDATWDDQSSGIIYTYFLAGNDTVGITGKVLSEERTAYTNFSQSDYAKNFAVPEINGESYFADNVHHVHSWIYESNGDSTCVSDGTKTGTCNVKGCNVQIVKADEGSKLEHSYTNYVSNNDATCTTDGTKTAACDYNCGATDIITDEGSKLGHSFTKYVSNSDATCTADGTKTAKCDRGCGITDTIPDEDSKLEHIWQQEKKVDKASTCISTGTKSIHCASCGEIKAGTEETIPVEEHKFSDYKSDGNATCTADGTKTAKCDRGCGTTDTIQDAGSKLGHSFTKYVSNSDATCTADGTKTAACDHGCGTTDTIQDAGSKLGHSFTKYVSNSDATCTADGTKTAKCDRGCGAADTVTDAGTKLPGTIKLNVTSIRLKVKQSTKKVTVSGLSKGDRIVSWTSSKPSVASVTQKGKITGKKKGTATVTVKLLSGKTGKIKVSVQKSTVTTKKITGVPKTLTVKKGKKKKLTPVLAPITSGQRIKYKTSNKKVAAISSSGRITGKKKGKAVITVSSGKVTVKCKVTVK